MQPLLHDHQQQVGDECDPNLDLYGIGTFPIEVFLREILFYLLEEEFYFPSLAIAMISVVSDSISFVSREMSLCFFSSA